MVSRENLRVYLASKKADERSHIEDTLLWSDGARIQKFYEKLREADLEVGPDGKGRDV